MHPTDDENDDAHNENSKYPEDERDAKQAFRYCSHDANNKEQDNCGGDKCHDIHSLLKAMGDFLPTRSRTLSGFILRTGGRQFPIY